MRCLHCRFRDISTFYLINTFISIILYLTEDIVATTEFYLLCLLGLTPIKNNRVRRKNSRPCSTGNGVRLTFPKSNARTIHDELTTFIT